MTCDDLAKKLREFGYTVICTEGIADLVTGWIHKNGSIKYVLVNGKTKYKKGDLFNYDAKIEMHITHLRRKCKCIKIFYNI